MPLFVGCASLSPISPPPVSCPKPPQLPVLDKLPAEVADPSFLLRLEKRMWQKPNVQTSSDYTLRPATPSTTGLKKP
jgi:hypothetical protein